MKEIWKKIGGYDDYFISNLGNVKSLKNNQEKILKYSLSSSKYPQVILCKNGIKKNYLIHRLVANEFLENKNNYEEINHKDENKLNNHVSNLEWCSHKYNMNYGNIKEKQSNAKKIKVAKLNKNDNKIIEVYKSIKEAAKINNCTEPNIVACCKHKKHHITCKGYKWEYIN